MLIFILCVLPVPEPKITDCPWTFGEVYKDGKYFTTDLYYSNILVCKAPINFVSSETANNRRNIFNSKLKEISPYNFQNCQKFCLDDDTIKFLISSVAYELSRTKKDSKTLKEIYEKDALAFYILRSLKK